MTVRKAQSRSFSQMGYGARGAGPAWQRRFALRLRDLLLYAAVIGLVFANLWCRHFDPLIGIIEAFLVYAVLTVAHTGMAAIEAWKIEGGHGFALHQPDAPAISIGEHNNKGNAL